MALAYDKTWDLSAINIALATTGALLGDMRQAMRRLVVEILALDGGNNVCKGSCDSAAAGLDGVNRWAADASLVWHNAGVHSWMVIELRGVNAVAPYAQLCIDLNGAPGAEYNATIVFSEAAGFTGGTTSARPTAADEQLIISAAQWIGTTTAGNLVLNVTGSNDGQCLRFWMWKAGGRVLSALIDKPKNPISGWTTPHVYAWSIAAAPWTYANIQALAAFKAKVNGTAVTFALATLHALGGTVGARQTAAHPITGAMPASGCTLWTETATRGPGAYGALFDFFFGSTTQADNDVYPASGARTHIALDDIIQPWPDSAPVTA